MDLRADADALDAKATALEERSSRRFDHAPGSAVTGSAGRRRSGLHKRTNAAIEGSLNDLAKAKACRERAGRLRARADRLDPGKVAEAHAESERTKRTRKAIDKAESSARAALPLVNDPVVETRMTMAEYQRIGKDFRGIMDCEGYRVRSAIRDYALRPVFITDKPVRLIPETGAYGGGGR